jgi:hypothetical protein
VKIYVIRTKHNTIFTVPDCKLWVVDVEPGYWQMRQSLINEFVNIALPQTQDMQMMGGK